MKTPVVIVGLGRIGAGNGGSNVVPLNHLAAAGMVPTLSIGGLVDPDGDVRERVRSQHPGIPAERIVPSLSELPDRAGEAIVICTPSSLRLEAVREALVRRPRLLVVEKPLAMSLDDARRIVEWTAKDGVELRINFHRRFDPRHGRWRARAPRRPRAIVARYGKGLMNYGSHLVDLLMDWYGPIESVQALSSLPADTADPSISFRCRMAAGFDAVVVGLDAVEYDQFEIDIMGQNEQISLKAGGADIRRYVPMSGLHYAGYSHLAEIEAERDIAPVGGFLQLHQAIGEHVNAGVSFAGCDGATALAGMAVLEAVRRSAAAGGTIKTPGSILTTESPQPCTRQTRS